MKFSTQYVTHALSGLVIGWRVDLFPQGDALCWCSSPVGALDFDYVRSSFFMLGEPNQRHPPAKAGACIPKHNFAKMLRCVYFSAGRFKRWADRGQEWRSTGQKGAQTGTFAPSWVRSDALDGHGTVNTVIPLQKQAHLMDFLRSCRIRYQDLLSYMYIIE